MNTTEQRKFDSLYHQHISALTRQGKAKNTIEGYGRAVRRITTFFDQCPDQLAQEQLHEYFDELIKSHSWSTVKIDRNGLQFFYKHVLDKQWQWIDIVKPPQKKVLPDILTQRELVKVINHTRERRYQTFILTVYSMGLRLGETLNLQVKDIDADRMKVHVRQGKGRKDRFVTLPERTLLALRRWWITHRHPKWLFPGGKTAAERQVATKVMDRGGVQKSFKAIVQDSGIYKAITIHSLRHCYDAHLVEAGVHLRKIQSEMGHECPKITALYTQLSQESHQSSEQLINRMINGLSLEWAQEVDHVNR